MNFEDCLNTWQGHGLKFEYPDIWDVSHEADDGDTIVTVTLSDTCFWLIRILPACPPPPQVVQSCIDAYDEEYEEVESEKVDCSLAGLPAYARNLSFFCLELMNNVGLRSVRTMDFTLLLLWQGTHHEMAEFHEGIDRMTQSIRVE